MKILVTGLNGQLGHDVCAELDRRQIQNRGVDIQDFDLTDANAVRAYIEDYAPTHVIHCAAYTAVDKAEQERDLCFKVNEQGTRYIAQVCAGLKAIMLYVSTDYVFPGTGTTAYKPDDPTGPLGVYGASKLGGEQALRELLPQYFIVRTSWVFGLNGHNFVRTMLKLAEQRKELNVVGDQIGSPTYTPDLARLLCDMIVTDKYGVYHATNEGLCSWADFAKEIFALAGKDVTVHPITTEEYPTPAQRPLNSRLSKQCLSDAGFERLPEWKDALKRYIKALNALN